MAITTQTTRVFFNGTNVATTGWIYNASESALATSGWVRCKSDDAVVQVCVATMNAGTMAYRIEGKLGDSSFDRAASFLTTIVTSADPIDKLHIVNARFQQIRVGIKCVGATGTNNFYAAVCRSDQR